MRAILVLIIALALGGAAFVFATKAMGSKSAPKAKPAVTKVVVAVLDIPAGSGFNKPESLKVIDWPAGKVPVGAFSDVAQLKGRILKSPATGGAIILESMLAPKGAIGGMSAMVAPGSRAMTIRVDDVIGVAGFTLPGNYVDVVSYLKFQKTKTEDRDIAMSKIVLEKVLVLAVAQKSEHEDTSAKIVDTVTLQVTPEQAEILDMVRNTGKLSLALRNQSDEKTTDTAGVTNLLLMQPTKTNSKTKAKTTTKSNCSQVINGTQVGKECF